MDVSCTFSVPTVSLAHYNHSVTPPINLHLNDDGVLGCFCLLTYLERTTALVWWFHYVYIGSLEKDCHVPFWNKKYEWAKRFGGSLAIHHGVQMLHNLNMKAMQANGVSKWANKYATDAKQQIPSSTRSTIVVNFSKMHRQKLDY